MNWSGLKVIVKLFSLLCILSGTQCGQDVILCSTQLLTWRNAMYACLRGGGIPVGRNDDLIGQQLQQNVTLWTANYLNRNGYNGDTYKLCGYKIFNGHKIYQDVLYSDCNDTLHFVCCKGMNRTCDQNKLELYSDTWAEAQKCKTVIYFNSLTEPGKYWTFLSTVLQQHTFDGQSVPNNNAIDYCGTVSSGLFAYKENCNTTMQSMCKFRGQLNERLVANYTDECFIDRRETTTTRQTNKIHTTFISTSAHPVNNTSPTGRTNITTQVVATSGQPITKTDELSVLTTPHLIITSKTRTHDLTAMTTGTQDMTGTENTANNVGTQQITGTENAVMTTHTQDIAGTENIAMTADTRYITGIEYTAAYVTSTDVYENATADKLTTNYGVIAGGAVSVVVVVVIAIVIVVLRRRCLRNRETDEKASGRQFDSSKSETTCSSHNITYELQPYPEHDGGDYDIISDKSGIYTKPRVTNNETKTDIYDHLDEREITTQKQSGCESDEYDFSVTNIGQNKFRHTSNDYDKTSEGDTGVYDSTVQTPQYKGYTDNVYNTFKGGIDDTYDTSEKLPVHLDSTYNKLNK